jgi:HEAT repeat protein
MRYEAARACGELQVRRAVPALIELISDSDREVRVAAVTALGQIGGKRARQVLERLCQDGDEVMQLVAEDALAELELAEQPLNLTDDGQGM